ncbi:MAG: hypothetical protein ACNS61_02285 [Candidatus Wenzhouxiangella sp. M2_3B_020]
MRQCNHFIRDSDFKDDTKDNGDVLDDAHRIGADAAVLSDVYHDADATVTRLRDGLQTADDHIFSGTLVLPLQPPHAESYHRLKDDAPRGVWWAIGGMKDERPHEKLAAARELRDATGPEAWIHGLGYGVTDAVAEAVAESPGLFNSIDASTAAQSAQDGTIAAGEERMTVVAARATAHRLEKLRRLAGYTDERSKIASMADF